MGKLEHIATDDAYAESGKYDSVNLIKLRDALLARREEFGIHETTHHPAVWGGGHTSVIATSLVDRLLRVEFHGNARPGQPQRASAALRAVADLIDEYSRAT
jgi:hypothetical protein